MSHREKHGKGGGMSMWPSACFCSRVLEAKGYRGTTFNVWLAQAFKRSNLKTFDNFGPKIGFWRNKP